MDAQMFASGNITQLIYAALLIKMEKQLIKSQHKKSTKKSIQTFKNILIRVKNNP